MSDSGNGSKVALAVVLTIAACVAVYVLYLKDTNVTVEISEPLAQQPQDSESAGLGEALAEIMSADMGGDGASILIDVDTHIGARGQIWGAFSLEEDCDIELEVEVLDLRHKDPRLDGQERLALASTQVSGQGNFQSLPQI